MKDIYRKQIWDEFYNCVANTISRIEDDESLKPFHQALLSDEILLSSKFERSFSTSFGQRVIEEVARIAAIANGASDCCRQKKTYIAIDSNIDNAISNHIKELRGGEKVDYWDWEKSFAHVLSTPKSGSKVEVRIISDLWWRKDGIDNYMSIKTVKPNIDQTGVAKEDCLKLKCFDPNCNVFFGLPYNPFGDRRSDYCFSPPYSIFDMQHDSVVLIGRDMWDTIGGHGCYEEILAIAEEVGEETKKLLSQKIKK